VLTGQDVALLEGDALGRPGALNPVVILLMVRSQPALDNRSSGQTSLLETGTDSWTMLPISRTLAFKSFSFSAAEAIRSFFSFSRSAEACGQHL
jgi:hypothetical protein